MLNSNIISHRAMFVTIKNPETDLEALLLALEAGDTTALQQLYQLWGRQVFSLAYAITHEREAAEEITQDVFVRVWRKVEQFQKGTNFRAWLLKITRNLALDHLKRNRHQANLTPLWDDDFLASDTHEEETHWVREALFQLSGEQRRAIELAYLQGMTHEQIAEGLEIPLGTIKTRIRDGVQKLRQLWEKDHDS